MHFAVVGDKDGDELTIWDSTESEFSSGLEYRNKEAEQILDLDWSSSPDAQSILAVGYARHVDILCQQRMTYFDQGPGWASIHRIDISRCGSRKDVSVRTNSPLHAVSRLT